jgi:hypothetical protein
MHNVDFECCLHIGLVVAWKYGSGVVGCQKGCRHPSGIGIEKEFEKSAQKIFDSK